MRLDLNLEDIKRLKSYINSQAVENTLSMPRGGWNPYRLLEIVFGSPNALEDAAKYLTATSLQNPSLYGLCDPVTSCDRVDAVYIRAPSLLWKLSKNWKHPEKVTEQPEDLSKLFAWSSVARLLPISKYYSYNNIFIKESEEISFAPLLQDGFYWEELPTLLPMMSSNPNSCYDQIQKLSRRKIKNRFISQEHLEMHPHICLRVLRRQPQLLSKCAKNYLVDFVYEHMFPSSGSDHEIGPWEVPLSVELLSAYPKIIPPCLSRL